MPSDEQGRRHARPAKRRHTPDARQVRWLARGLDQPGGKLPLFDENGSRVGSALVRSCIKAGWAEPWFRNPIKPDWEVCRLTERGRATLATYAVVRVDFGRGPAGRLT